MNEIIVADLEGNELRSMLFTEYDFEVGDDENSFLITALRSEWQNLPENARIYIPNTEYGGLYKKTEVVGKKNGTVAAGGYTWRGMLQKRIVCPESGADYATDSGELNSIIGARVAAAYPGLFVGSSDNTGITVSYQYARYCKLYDGLKSMLKSVGYKLRLTYSQTLCKVVVDAVPIVDYSDQIEYSSDMNADYTMELNYTGVNHLICLGSGELRNRTVIHLYVDRNGVISQTQTQFDEDEITAVYDYPGAADSDLIQSGTDQLKRGVNLNKFSIDLESATDVAIGDIVGSRDYITGLTMTAPIVTKIIKWEEGFTKTEYKLSEDVVVEDATLNATS